MFGLFKSKEEKAQLKLLQELEEGGAARSADPRVRRRHAHLVHMLRGEGDALPLYESIAADFPDAKRAAFIAATILLENGDPAGLEMMEAVARARPSLAGPAYRTMTLFHDAAGAEDEALRLGALMGDAFDAEEAALAEGRFVDPGGPLEAPRYDAQDLEFIRAGLASARGLRSLLAGSRTLDDGAIEQVLLIDADDPEGAMERVVEIMSIYGDFVLFANQPNMQWLRAQLEQITGSRIYPG